MAQAMVNFRMDADLKKEMEATCKEMGLTVSAAYTLFAKKVTREQIQFEALRPSLLPNVLKVRDSDSGFLSPVD